MFENDLKKDYETICTKEHNIRRTKRMIDDKNVLGMKDRNWPTDTMHSSNAFKVRVRF